LLTPGASLSWNDAVLLDQRKQLFIGQPRTGSEIRCVVTEITAWEEERNDRQDQREKAEGEQASMSFASFIDFGVLRLVLRRDLRLLAGL
jgi:hypothetical protein